MNLLFAPKPLPMYYRLTCVLFFWGLLTAARPAHGQELVLVSGQLRDHATREPLEGVSVQVPGTAAGTTTGPDGQFSLKTRLQFPFTLQFSAIGYTTQQFAVRNATDPIQVELETQAILGQEVVVTASRIDGSRLSSPVAVEKLSVQALRESPAAGFYEALENVKGVQMTTSSLTFKVPNTRGFNSPNNFRFMQLTDGVDMQAATLGVPLGNAIGATEPDIESVEITPGAASALYGMNALNGLASLQTKSPFKYPGLSVYQKVGVNHVDGRDHAPALLTETALRLARVVGKKWAFKLNASYLHGTDWRSGNATDQNPQPAAAANPAFAALSGAANPAADYWNRYGDENNNSVPVTIPYQGKNQTFNIRRTGYCCLLYTSPSPRD